MPPAAVEEIASGSAPVDSPVVRPPSSGLVPVQPPAVPLEAKHQAHWAALPLKSRLNVLKRMRHAIAADVHGFTEAISPVLSRTAADTIVAEVLPLLAACRFLEGSAAEILATRNLGSQGRPFWLGGVESTIERVPFGTVLIIAPSNYPLFLAGVQCLQALVAGNAVIWKPAPGGRAAALRMAEHLDRAGLPHPLFHITDESVDAVHEALRGTFGARPAKVFFTGSAATGRKLMAQLAEALTPCVMELSGCDAVFVLPSADVPRTIKALCFGMRLNGSATCMAPRRVLLTGANRSHQAAFAASLILELGKIAPATISPGTQHQLAELIPEAVAQGAILHGSYTGDAVRPILLTGVRPTMRIAQADVFAPLLMLINAAGVDDALLTHDMCPYALTASIFGAERDALQLAGRVVAGSVLVNDVIVPTADPRVPFGGRRQSGFGATRGAEGLLEMTAAKVISVRRNRSTRHLDPTGPAHEELFQGTILASHGGSLRTWISGMQRSIKAARSLKNE